jgi:transposase InsO family protein
MPWQEVSVMGQREAFVRLASLEGANRRELCRRFGIHPDTGYKWLRRRAAGETELTDHSRRPHCSPNQTDAALEAKVLAVRDAHPAWGARKLAACLKRENIAPPAASTVHAILRRNDRVTETAGQGAPSTRFEKAAPNLLWQMDFKGWVKRTNGTRCHPLTVVDDHSRYLVNLTACANQTEETVRGHLETAFRHHGLPEAMFVDNGSPWGGGPGERWTHFGVWLLKLGVRVLHSRPYHPQSRGKNERFHRTLNQEVLSMTSFRGLREAQRAFDAWLPIYNGERPHEALAMAVPADRYRPSLRPMPARLMEPEYDEGDIGLAPVWWRGESLGSE